MNPAAVKPSVKVATIMDEMIYHWFKDEGDFLQLTPDNWQRELEEFQPDFLFVHSAWYGVDEKWYLKICELNSTMDQTLKNLVSWCRKKEIPTVFWNMEDPLHFHQFIEAAKLFDFIFTTDEDCIPRYIEILGHNRVYLLPFAAHPKLHNPVNRSQEPLGKVAFAGTWYSRGHEDRNRDMERVLKPAFPYGLTIYDRMYHHKSSNYFKYPEEYKPYTVEPLPYMEMVEAYKRYPVFLNVNSVQKSPTMFACRVFELLACGTNVVSGYALGIDMMLPGLVLLSKTPQETKLHLDSLLGCEEYRERLSLRGQRIVLHQHTYSKRLQQILQKLNLFHPSQNESEYGITLFTVTQSPEPIMDIINNYTRQKFSQKELFIFVNKDNASIRNWTEAANNLEKVNIIPVTGRLTTAQALGHTAKLAQYKYLANFTEDAYYAPEYIGDIMNCFKYANTPVVGKSSHYSYNAQSKTLILVSPKREYQYTNTLPVSAFAIEKNMINEISFSPDDKWIKGAKLYSSDKYNFVKTQKEPVDTKHEIAILTDFFQEYVTV